MFAQFGMLLDDGSQDVWQDFERWIEIKGRSPHTRDQYGRVLVGLHRHASCTPLLEITRPQVIAWLDDAKRAGKADNTRLTYWRNSRSWYSWAVRENWLAESPAEGIGKPEVKPVLKTVLTAAELAAFPAAWKGSDFYSLRNRAIFELLRTFGTPRNAELCDLDVPDVEMRLSLIRIRNGKGGIARDIPFSATTGRALTRYSAARRKVAIPGETAFFVNYMGRRLGNQGLREICNVTAERAGISAHVHPHLWRHATWDVWQRLGGSREDGEKLWGWRDGSGMPGYYAAASAGSRAIDAGRALLIKAGL